MMFISGHCPVRPAPAFRAPSLAAHAASTLPRPIPPFSARGPQFPNPLLNRVSQPIVCARESSFFNDWNSYRASEKASDILDLVERILAKVYEMDRTLQEIKNNQKNLILSVPPKSSETVEEEKARLQRDIEELTAIMTPISSRLQMLKNYNSDKF